MRDRVSIAQVILLAVLTAALCPHVAQATTFVLMDEATLLRSSDAVLVGTVTAIEAGADADGMVHTYVHVQPERVIKGMLGPDEVVLREPGGSTGELEQRVYGVPEFWVGERTLLFLSRNADGTLQTNSLAMGKYSVAVDAAGQATAVRDLGDGSSLLIPTTGEVVAAPRQSQRFLPLLRRLRKLAHAERRTRQPARPVTTVPEELSTVTTRFQAAYTFLGSPPARWFEPDTGQPVTYLIDSSGDKTLGFANSMAAIDAGLGAWSNVATARLVLQDGGTTAPGPFDQCSISRILFNDPAQEIPDPVNCSGVLAMGGYCAAYNTKVINNTNFVQIGTGKLTFNNGWGGCGLWTLCNVSEVMAHELGHTIGLGHSSDSASTMYAYAHFDGRCASLRSDDIAGVSFVYPLSGPKAATPTATPARSPTPTPTAPPTATAIPTGTPTADPNPTVSATPIASPTPVRTATPSPTRTATAIISPTATRTWTPSPLPTATPTATPSVVSIGGRISYAGSGVAVSATTVQWQGKSAGSVQTDSAGQFAITGLPSAWWSVQPAKTGDAGNAIDVVDAVTILEVSAGLRRLIGSQQLACDTSGDGRVDVDDAVLILEYVVGLTARFPAAQNCGSDWAFIPQPALVPFELKFPPKLSSNSCQPGALSFEPLVGSAFNQDFSAVLFGDCAGDWQPGDAGAVRAAQPDAGLVRLGRVRAAPRAQTVRVPLSVDARQPFRTLQVDLRYDAVAMRATDVRLAPAASQALLQANLSVPGTVRLALASAVPLPGGTVATLEFDSAGGQRPAPSVVRAVIGRQ